MMVHHDQRGAMGYIINKPVDVDFGTLISSVNAQLQPKILAERFQKTVYFGGPVRIEQLWVLYKQSQAAERAYSDLAAPAPELGKPVLPDSFQSAFAGALGDEEPGGHIGDFSIGERWALSASGRVIEDFAMHPTDDYFMPVLGYAGWGAGQLEEEIGEGSWLLADFDDSLIFETQPFDRWKRALDEMKVDPMSFLMMGEVGQA